MTKQEWQELKDDIGLNAMDLVQGFLVDTQPPSQWEDRLAELTDPKGGVAIGFDLEVAEEISVAAKELLDQLEERH